MKILIFTQAVDTQDPILGFFHDWIREFSKKAEKIIVVCLREGEHSLPDNVKVLSLGKEKGTSRIKYIFNFYRYIIEERKNYDFVFVHMNQIYVILGGLLWRFWRKKIGLWYAHGHVPFGLRIATILTHYVFTSTESGFRLTTNKKHIVGQGIDINKFKPKEISSNHTFTIISVGRMSPVKDYQTLIKAVAQISNIRLLVVGGPVDSEQQKYTGSLIKLVEEKEISNRVKFVGNIPNSKLPQYIEISDMMVNTSHTGSLDKTMLEAMAMEVPVITCNEAMREVLGEYKDLFMFSKKDVNALVGRINTYKEKRENLGPQMREIVVKDHSLDNFIEKILKIYNL